MTDPRFWKGRRVFLTGHTGFKGAWLSIWLEALDAKVAGYALKPPTRPSIFELCRLDRRLESNIGDVRDAARLRRALAAARPEVVLHMAAQPLVRLSYKEPAETYETNVMGVVNLLEAVRACPSVKAVVNVTTDKCYQNEEHNRPFREHEAMGGHDPYSSSKGCAELVTAAYRASFFNPKDYKKHGVAVASARAGNVIGGGDWAADRLIPDIVRAGLRGEKVRIRSPRAVRPWQHVLEPLSGYLLLAEKLYKRGPAFAEGWNFGPDAGDAKDVEWIVKRMFTAWPEAAGYAVDKGPHPHEAHFLRLDSGKAHRRLGWRPRWRVGRAIDKIVEWTRAYQAKDDMYKVCLKQITEYVK